MPCDEFDDWMLYYEWKYEQEKKARQKAEQKNKKPKSKNGKNVVTF